MDWLTFMLGALAGSSLTALAGALGALTGMIRARRARRYSGIDQAET